MSATCKMIAAALEKLAPCELAECWDNVGLLVGSMGQKVDKVLLTIDVTADVIAEAAGKRAGLIISHHPFPFQAMKNVRTDTAAGALLTQLLMKQISVYAAHTNLDASDGGVNDALAEVLNLHDVSQLQPRSLPLVKIVTYVPASHLEAVWQAMTAAGAGHIGNYSECSFRVTGTGTFLPGDGARPFVGEPYRVAKVEEVRLETVAPASLSKGIVQSLLDAHPYEEVAYDLYPLQNEWPTAGMGRIGNLLLPLTLSEFAAQVKTLLCVPGIRFIGKPETQVHRVAVCGGAGMSAAGAARRAGAQVLVTGDIRYHDAQDAVSDGLCLIDAGHFGTEFPILDRLQRYLRDCSASDGWNCEFEIARSQSEIWQWV